MKKITKITALLALVFTLGFNNLSKAQCAASFISLNWTNGVVGFTSTSVPNNSVTLYSWNYGTSTTFTAMGINGMTPNYQYTANGTYTVSLTISIGSPACISTFTQTIVVTNAVPPSTCNLIAGMSNALPGGPGLMNFTNNSTGTTSATTYTWNYGDNTTSNGVNGTHTYAANGTYWVSLFASNNTNPACTDSVAIPVTITNVCGLVAGYTYTAGTNGQVSFQSTSTGTAVNTNHYWNFGDGGNASGVTASHTYSNGTYSAVLTVQNNSVSPNCINSVTQTIVVTSNTCALTSSFTYSQSTAGLVSFVNTSAGTNGSTLFNWNFGNGFTSSSANPTNTYLNGGIYLVTLTVTNGASPTCSTVSSQTVNITSVQCSANPNFTLMYAGTPGFWNATPAYPWNVVNAVWSWGDASSSTGMYSSHTYSVSGNYIICLSVTVSCGATASTCSTYSVYRSSGASIYKVNVIEPQLKSVDESNNVGIKETTNSQMTIGLYPNPANQQFALMVQGLESEKCSLTLTDALGRTVIAVNQNADNGQLMEIIDVSEQASGVYFLTLTSGSQQMTKKVIIAK